MESDGFVRRAELHAMDKSRSEFRIDHCEVALGGLEKVLHDVKDVERERVGS